MSDTKIIREEFQTRVEVKREEIPHYRKIPSHICIEFGSRYKYDYTEIITTYQDQKRAVITDSYGIPIGFGKWEIINEYQEITRK